MSEGLASCTRLCAPCPAPRPAPHRGGGGGGGGGISGAAPNTSASLGSWVLQNLGRSTSTSSRTDSAGGGQDVGGLTPQQREMLNRVAVQGAAGRAVRPGNPLPLPLLGHTLLCMWV